MIIERTKLPSVTIYTINAYSDERGAFMETVGKYHNFYPLQANMSISKKGVVRGLHYQKDTAKLVWVAKGAILDVAMDPDTGEKVEVELNDKNHKQLYVPPNFVHGFQALEDDTVVCYVMDKYYDPKTEGGYNPSTIKWPLKATIISDKDKHAPTWSKENAGIPQ